MTDKFKRIDRQYVLSDSTVNEYGFRLLTSGYQLEAFQKNPIGYYMHRREDGIALKWEDLHVEDDKVMGTPVINLSNQRGGQTCDEAEHGFLNAASVGHIVVLEYSTDEAMMLPGQTGPTITKWYNKECSLVDIPGNCNALTRLYDAQENELNLVDMNIVKPVISLQQGTVLQALGKTLQLEATADEQTIVSKVTELAARAAALEAENKALGDNRHILYGTIELLNRERTTTNINTLLDRALEDRKITVALRDQLASDYAANADGLKELLDVMPAYRTIAEVLSSRPADKGEGAWLWDDYEQHDPAGKKLKDLRANDPVRYKELFDKKFNAQA